MTACSPDDTSLVAGEALLVDDFATPVRPGRTPGSAVTTGPPRRARDPAGRLSVDGGALRVSGPLTGADGAHDVLTYGPLRATTGLVVGVWVGAAHHASDDDAHEDPLGERLRGRVRQWVLGADGDAPLRRMVRYLRSPHHRGIGRRVDQWRRLRARGAGQAGVNFVVGWAAGPVGRRLAAADTLFAVQPSAGDNATLLAGVDGEPVEVWPELRNVPLLLVAVWTDDGVVLLARGAARLPGGRPDDALRPLAFDPAPRPRVARLALAFGGVGQGGFRSDTRVERVEAVRAADAARPVLVDCLTGDGTLPGASSSGAGVSWTGDAALRRTPHGAGSDVAAAARCHPEAPCGLVVAHVTTGGSGAAVLWLTAPGTGGTTVVVRAADASLRAGGTDVPAQADALLTMPDASASPDQRRVVHGLGHRGVTVQLALGPWGARLTLDGAPPLTVDARPAQTLDPFDPRPVLGIATAGGALIRDLVAWPARVGVPGLERHVRPEAWLDAEGSVVLHDEFRGGGLVDGRVPPLDRRPAVRGSPRSWSVSGTGRAGLAEDGLRVVVDPAAHRGRTLATVGWHEPRGADLRVVAVPPGSGPGHGHRARPALVWWQDERTQLVVNAWLDDTYGGGAVCAWLRLCGFEDPYEASWCNVGSALRHGVPVELRAVFDGWRYRVWLDEVAVLERAVSDTYPLAPRMRVRRVGTGVAWDWGHDTQTLLTDFTARTLPRAAHDGGRGPAGPAETPSTSS